MTDVRTGQWPGTLPRETFALRFRNQFRDPACAVEGAYELSVDGLEAEERIDRARQVWADPATPSRVLVVVGASRNDGTCPGEMSKTLQTQRPTLPKPRPK
jgi:hypothetical protein